jgi:hypothetical protein
MVNFLKKHVNFSSYILYVHKFISFKKTFKLFKIFLKFYFFPIIPIKLEYGL